MTHARSACLAAALGFGLLTIVGTNAASAIELNLGGVARGVEKGAAAVAKDAEKTMPKLSHVPGMERPLPPTPPAEAAVPRTPPNPVMGKLPASPEDLPSPPVGGPDANIGQYHAVPRTPPNPVMGKLPASPEDLPSPPVGGPDTNIGQYHPGGAKQPVIYGKAPSSHLNQYDSVSPNDAAKMEGGNYVGQRTNPAGNLGEYKPNVGRNQAPANNYQVFSNVKPNKVPVHTNPHIYESTTDALAADVAPLAQRPSSIIARTRRAIANKKWTILIGGVVLSIGTPITIDQLKKHGVIN